MADSVEEPGQHKGRSFALLGNGLIVAGDADLAGQSSGSHTLDQSRDARSVKGCSISQGIQCHLNTLEQRGHHGESNHGAAISPLELAAQPEQRRLPTTHNTIQSTGKVTRPLGSHGDIVCYGIRCGFLGPRRDVLPTSLCEHVGQLADSSVHALVRCRHRRSVDTAVAVPRSKPRTAHEQGARARLGLVCAFTRIRHHGGLGLLGCLGSWCRHSPQRSQRELGAGLGCVEGSRPCLCDR